MMRPRHLVMTAVRGLTTHKSRSVLTMLGIIIGIASIMLIAAVGRSAQGLILSEISGTGANMVVVRPGKEPSGPTDFADTLFADSLTERDLDALRRTTNVPHASAVVPMLVVSGSVEYRGETYRPQTLGTSAEFVSEQFQIYPERGTIFTEEDIRAKARVAVIGSKVAEELFGNEPPLGKMIAVKGQSVRVVGVFPPRGQVAFFNVDDIVLVPYSTAQTYMLGIHHFHEILVRVSESAFVDRTVEDIELTLRERHRITDSSKDDFYVVTQEGLVSQIQTIISVLTIFLSLVVAVALVVGGIGVMNIMLVSVTERTREIGLRKALGATRRDILYQFTMEAIMLTSLGGFIGVVLGLLLSFITSVIITTFFGLSWPFIIPIFQTFLGILVAVGVGLTFGLYPALQASRKQPIEALRYE